jgi:hypothetical protein
VLIITAEPASQAAVAVWTIDSRQVDRPALGRPLRLGRLAQVQVFVTARDTDDGASCTLILDGVLVDENSATGPGVVASCVWPE